VGIVGSIAAMVFMQLRRQSTPSNQWMALALSGAEAMLIAGTVLAGLDKNPALVLTLLGAATVLVAGTEYALHLPAKPTRQYQAINDSDGGLTESLLAHQQANTGKVAGVHYHAQAQQKQVSGNAIARAEV
jgi:hypothetical protein